MENFYALIITFMAGAFILIGSLLSLISKNNSRFIHFSISMAFGVMSLLLFLELFPEVFEIFEGSLQYPLVFIIIGIFLIKALDYLVPEHSHECCSDHDHDESFMHIGLVSIIALLIHQFVEGMAVFVTTISSVSAGLLLSIAVGLHGIPIGMAVTSTIFKATRSFKKTISYVLLLVLSPFLGGVLVILNKDLFYGEFMTGLLLSLTVGMILYIMIFELLPHIFKYKNKKDTFLGILSGFLVMYLSMLI